VAWLDLDGFRCHPQSAQQGGIGDSPRTELPSSNPIACCITQRVPRSETGIRSSMIGASTRSELEMASRGLPHRLTVDVAPYRGSVTPDAEDIGPDGTISKNPCIVGLHRHQLQICKC
jgi:hypothetical protein